MLKLKKHRPSDCVYKPEFSGLIVWAAIISGQHPVHCVVRK